MKQLYAMLLLLLLPLLHMPRTTAHSRCDLIIEKDDVYEVDRDENLSSLQLIDLNDTELGYVIALFRNVKTICLINCNKITDDSIRLIAQVCTELEDIYFCGRNSKISDEALKEFKEFKELQETAEPGKLTIHFLF